MCIRDRARDTHSKDKSNATPQRLRKTDNTREDRKLEAAESLALIGRMIENTRSRMVRNSGRPLLAWGYRCV